MATQRIGNNRITDGEVTGPKLGLNSIGANNFTSAANTYITAATPTDATQNTNITTAQNSAAAAFTRANNSLNANTGGVVEGAVVMTAPLAVRSNLNIQTVTETANIYSTAVFGNVILALANNTTYYFATPPTANVTLDLRANDQPGGSLDAFMVTGQMISVGVLLPQGATAYRANVYVDGVLQTANVRWAGNVNPLGGGTANGIDVYNFSVLKRGANSYIILASNTVFANGASA